MYFQETRHEQRSWDNIRSDLDRASVGASNLIETLRVELDDARAKIEDLEGKVESLTEDLNHYRNKYE